MAPTAESFDIMEGVDKSIPARLLHIPKIPKLKSKGNIKSNVQFMASYNWIKSGNGAPAIAVPGHPPHWTPCLPLIQLPSDEEASLQQEPLYAHQYTFEPLLAALDICQPNHDFSNIHIVTEVRNLQKLFNFASGKRHGFRVDVEVIGRTIFLNRFENDEITMKTTHSSNSRDLAFQDYATTQCAHLRQLEASSYHRIIKYKLSRLNIAVQYKVDSCLCSCQEKDDGRTDDDAVANGSSLRVSQHGAPGDLLDRSHIADITTREIENHESWTFSQLWFSSTFNLCFAQHDEGLFTKVDPVPRSMKKKVKEWQVKNKRKLRVVAETLKLIIGEVSFATMRHQSTRFALIRQTGEKEKQINLYRLREDYGSSVLPLAARERLESASN